MQFIKDTAPAGSKNVLLLNLPSRAFKPAEYEDDVGYNPSFALISLGSFLEWNGYNPVLLDLCATPVSPAVLLETIHDTSPLLVGISVHTENVAFGLRLAEKLKSSFKDLPVVMGGPHATLMPEHVINSPFVDFVIRFEGEASLLELAEALFSGRQAIAFRQIDGLVYKEHGAIIRNRERGFIQDLDLLPILKRELAGLDHYNRVVNIITGRGCPGKCIYCAAPVLSGKQYRPRSIGNVFLEIVLLKNVLKERFKKIFIADDTFTVMRKRLLHFIGLMRRYPVQIPWHCQSRVMRISDELLGDMADTGCVGMLFGIESGNQEVLDCIAKGINLEMAEDLIARVYKHKIHPVLSFIIGHYCDTKETMEDTFRMVQKMYEMYKAEIAVFYNTPFPGTYQYENRIKLNMRLQAENFDLFTSLVPIVENPRCSLDDQRNVFYKSQKYCGRSFTLTRIKKLAGA